MRPFRLAVLACTVLSAVAAFATTPVVTFTTTSTPVAENAGAVSLHLQRNTTDVATTVTFNVYVYGATYGVDFGPVPPSVTFNIGESTKDLVIPIIDDSIYENDEEFEIYLSSITNGTSGYPYYSYVTIIDDDPAAVIGFSSASYVANENGGSVPVTVIRTNNTQATVAVNYATTDSSAHAGTDYTAVSGTLNFAAGETSKTINIPITNDAVYTGSRSFNVNLSNPSQGALISQNGASVNIADDDPPTYIQFSAGRYDVNEGAGSVAVTVTRTGNTSVTSGVTYQTFSQYAQAGLDFNSVTGTLTFAPGETSKNVTVSIVDDTVQEAPEYFGVTLTNVTGAVAGTLTLANVYITDNDIATVVSTSLPSRVGEKDGSALATITRSGDLSLTTTVSYQTTGNTTCCYPTASPTVDYTPVSGTVTFNAGETTKTVSIPILDDAVYEGDESFGFGLSGVQNGTLGTSVATTVILDDELAPTLSFSPSNYRVAENAGSVTLTVTRLGTTTGSSTVQYQTNVFSGTATAGTDYTVVSGMLTFAPGETSKTFTIPIIDDTVSEGDEYFFVSLNSPAGAVFGQPSATVTIADDEPDITVGFDANTFTVGEGAGSISIPVTRSSAVGTTTVSYFSSVSSASTFDFTPVSGSLTFNPGETTKSINVPIIDDATYEPTEMFFVVLNSFTGGRPGITSAAIQIRDNDPAPTLSINDVTLAEGNSGFRNATFTVTLSAPLQSTFAFNYDVKNGTATNGVDFTAAPSGSVLFNAGDVTRTISVLVSGDTLPENDETFYVVLRPVLADGAPRMAKATGTGTIVNDDAAFSASDVRVVEGNHLQLTVRLSPAQSSATSVEYSTLAGSAAAGADFIPVAGTLHFDAGETQKKVDITTNQDTLVEGDETFLFRLSNPVGAQLVTSEVTVTIHDDDEPFTTYNDVQYASPDGYPLLLDLYVPNGTTSPSAVIVWIHGDNWTFGSRTPTPAQRELMRGYAVASIDIRPSDVAHFPAQIFDAKAAVRWLRANAAQYHLDPQRIAAWGFGSGAHIASLLGTTGGVGALEDPSEGNAAFSSNVQAVIDWAGPADVSQLSADALACSTQNWDSSGSYLSIFLGCTAKSCPEVATSADPTHYIDVNDPPFLIMHGDSDCDVAPAQSQSFARALKAGHVDVRLNLIPGGGHTDAFWESTAVTNVVDAFLDEVLKPAAGRRRATH